MANGHPHDRETRLDDVRLQAFARQVLSAMGHQSAQGHEDAIGLATDVLFNLALSPEGFSESTAAHVLALPGLSTTDLIDRCIPNVCRRAGDQWVSDDLSFVQVSVVGARMQALCHALTEAARWPSRKAALNVLVATAPGEQHMIGSVVLSSQLRRAGVSVRLVTGGDESRLLSAVGQGDYDAMLISAGNSFTLDSAARLISKVRSELESPPRLVVGGPIVGAEGSVSDNEHTGADLTTSDFKIALAGLAHGRDATDLMVA